MNTSGFIMLNRNIVDWEWYTDVNANAVFIHCLLKVNYSDKRWQGILIKKGEFITSYEKLAIETGLTISKVRTALSKLQLSNDIHVETTSSFTKISIVNLKEYVAKSNREQTDKPNDKLFSISNSKALANSSQSNDNHLATTKSNNIINRKKIFREKVFAHTQFSKELLNDFFSYWSETDRDKKLMKHENQDFFEIDKRLVKWKKNEKPKYTKTITSGTASNR
ncbi:hypothetical protein DFQ10_1084 [Winogradskyella eximia]|uniref:Uncharacterized protein n=1 Tax=Winogradskyella eximia TaxID=262006 RepID=A0A3D9GZA7_9FLAO|nr:hypothetical protein [Winogradskyella eximia]RED42598.1 hypothetical protein DFQ10_1084 [Winogradskyella eximia]